MRKPKKMQIDMIERLKINKSPTAQPIIANAENIIINEPLAKPWNPSIILIEFAIPDIAKLVNNRENI